MEKQKKYTQVLFYIFILLFLSFLTICYNTIDMDYWARIMQGNAFWELGHILKQDIFSFTPTHLWLDHEWGASVIFAFIQKFSGFNGILIFRTLIAFLIFILIYKNISLQTEKRNMYLDISLFLILAMSMRTITQSCLRCHFFTFLFFTLFLFILEKTRKQNNFKLLYILPLTMIFWANMHGGCISGLGILAIYTVGEFLNKQPFKHYFIVLLLCLLTLFINPYGFEYVKFLFMATTMNRPFVTEWISPFSHPVWNFMLAFKIMYIINIILLLFSLKRLKTDYTKYILLIICAYLSFKFIKNTPFFIITSAIFLYDEIVNLFNRILNSERLKKITAAALIIITCSLGIRIYYTNYSPFYLSQQPVQITEFIKINSLKGNIIAPFDIGSYLAYKLYPDNLIYMDGRYEEVYFNETKEKLDDFYNANENWDKVLEYNAEYVITPSDAAVSDLMDKRFDYKLIYKDEMYFLYAKTANIKPIYILPSNDYKYYLAHAFEQNFDFKSIIK